MELKEIIDQIDAEIARLQQARALLAAAVASPSSKHLSALKADRAASRKKKRNLSPEARAKIAAAQKRRWAAQRAAKK